MDGWKLTIKREPRGGHSYCWTWGGCVLLEGWTAGSRRDAQREAAHDRREHGRRAA